jgi:multidrug efflux pump
VNVQNRVNQASALLPDVVSQQGVTVQKRSQSFMMVISVYSPDDRYDPVYLGNYANLYILDAIKRIPGANLSSMFPLPDLAMRIWLKPDRLAQLGLTAQDVASAIQSQNKAFGVGSIGQSPSPSGTQQTFAVTTKGLLSEPAEFENIIIRAANEGSAMIRLKDVARVELGGKDYSISTKVNGKRSVAIVVYQQPGANAIETSKQIRELLTGLKKNFPQGLDYKVVLDTSEFTAASIKISGAYLF